MGVFFTDKAPGAYFNRHKGQQCSLLLLYRIFNEAYLFDLKSFALCRFVSKGTVSSITNNFLSLFQNMQMSGIKLVCVHSRGIVDRDGLASPARSLYMTVSDTTSTFLWIPERATSTM